MRTGTTSTGFAYEFDERNADDMRFVELIVQSSAEDTPDFEKLSAVSKLVEMLLGKDQKAALYKHIGERNEGRVPCAALENALAEIMSGDHELKK